VECIPLLFLAVLVYCHAAKRLNKNVPFRDGISVRQESCRSKPFWQNCPNQCTAYR